MRPVRLINCKINIFIMKVLLVYTNRYRVLASPPVGLAYLVEPLVRDGHEVKVLDLMFPEDPAGEMARAMEEFGPDVVGFSLRNVDDQDMADPKFFLPGDKEYVDMARCRGAITVLGGTAFTTLPAETLEYMGADYGIAGQGERGLPRLLRSLGPGGPDETIPGLVWRHGGRIRLNPPDFSGYRAERADWGTIDLDGYAGGDFPGAVVAKTGCPHKCAYCNVTSCFGGRFAFRDPEDIVAEIKALKHVQGIDGITLTDACFNVPPDYAKRVLRAIKGLGVRLHTSLVPVPGSYDDEFFRLFKDAGGALLSLGTETLSEKMLRSYHKPFTVKDVVRAAGLCHEHGIPFVVHALFGGPGEDADTIKETMELLPRIGCARFEYNIGIRLLPGTALFGTAKKEGLVKDESELFAPRFYVSKALDVAWADAYIKGKLKEYGL
jgi:radical SAM superfamily enzyme YgiQ (UPF0313 family)